MFCTSWHFSVTNTPTPVRRPSWSSGEGIHHRIGSIWARSPRPRSKVGGASRPRPRAAGSGGPSTVAPR
eukprot:566416-Lingulodinium_polyedra.AAC.1